jgi:long-chain acyl-CoA synthetase
MLLPLALSLPIIFPAALTGPQLVRALQEGQVTALLGLPRLYDALYRGIVDRFASRGRAAATLLAAGIGVSAWLRQRLRLQLGALLWRPVRRQVGPRLRVLTSGGALLDPALAWRLEGLGWQVAIGYGLTETAALLSLNPPGATKLDSVGRPPPGVALRIDP